MRSSQDHLFVKINPLTKLGFQTRFQNPVPKPGSQTRFPNPVP